MVKRTFSRIAGMQLRSATPGLQPEPCSCQGQWTTPNMFFMAKVTPDIEWSLRIGRPITIEHTRVRILDRRMFADPQRTDASSYPAMSEPKQRMRLGSVLMERPQTSRSSRLRSQITMLQAL